MGCGSGPYLFKIIRVVRKVKVAMVVGYFMFIGIFGEVAMKYANITSIPLI